MDLHTTYLVTARVAARPLKDPRTHLLESLWWLTSYLVSCFHSSAIDDDAMGKARPAPKRPASPSPSTYRKAARVAPSNSWSGSEAHHDLPEPVKVEQDIARVSQQPHSSMTADQETSTIHDLTLSSSYADMEDLDECDGGSMSSSNKSGKSKKSTHRAV